MNQLTKIVLILCVWAMGLLAFNAPGGLFPKWVEAILMLIVIAEISRLLWRSS